MSKEQKKRIWLSPPHMGGKEQEFVKEAFDSNWIAPLGPNVDAFEQQLREYTHTEAAAALNSGTGALHLAMVSLGVQPGDVVLCQSMTFAASAFPINYLGAEPVFIDSESSTWNMDPVLLQQALADFQDSGRKVAAIIVVHLYGMPAQMDPIMQIAAAYNVPVLEDAAEALGSVYMNRPCGSWGTAAILSFNGNKIITTSGGGALVSNHKQLVDHVRFLSTQAKDPFPYYEHSQIGYNYRMSNITAGIGRGQMLVIDERVAKRRNNYEIYETELAGLPGLEFVPEPEGFYSNRWLTTVLIDETLSGGITPDRVRLLLEEHNIESRPLWKPMHLQPVYENVKAYVNGVSDALFANGLCLPSGSSLTLEEQLLVCKLIKQCWNAE